jgi:4-hydroxy-tetrahydrodipicolinate synthase
MTEISPYFISALCTPLTVTDGLHEAGLEAHLNDQWINGIHGVLVAGTMGLLQLLTDEVYKQLCRRSIEISRGRGEIMIGAGDASQARTLERIEFLNTLDGIDGVVVLPPYFIQFSQPELIDHYTALANASKAPIYLYDLPQRTRSKIDLATVQTLIKHPNIKGIKCSDEIVSTRLVVDAVGAHTRVVVAQPLLLDVLLKFGIASHLDGIFAVTPRWVTLLGKAAASGDWELAASHQRKIVEFAKLLGSYGVFPAVTSILNARNIPGKFGPLPFQMLESERRAELLGTPIIQQLIAENRA